MDEIAASLLPPRGGEAPRDAPTAAQFSRPRSTPRDRGAPRRIALLPLREGQYSQRHGGPLLCDAAHARRGNPLDPPPGRDDAARVTAMPIPHAGTFVGRLIRLPLRLLPRDRKSV